MGPLQWPRPHEALSRRIRDRPPTLLSIVCRPESTSGWEPESWAEAGNGKEVLCFLRCSAAYTIWENLDFEKPRSSRTARRGKAKNVRILTTVTATQLVRVWARRDSSTRGSPHSNRKRGHLPAHLPTSFRLQTPQTPRSSPPRVRLTEFSAP